MSIKNNYANAPRWLRELVRREAESVGAEFRFSTIREIFGRMPHESFMALTAEEAGEIVGNYYLEAAL